LLKKTRTAGSLIEPMPSHALFDLDIPLAVREQLHIALEGLDTDPLEPQFINALPQQQGVYNLFHGGVVVYAGKADSLRGRLHDHWWKLTGRRNISVTDVRFKCLSLGPNWIAFAAENALINMYTGQGLCAWNSAGFGMHDPGRKRDDTIIGPEHWDAQYPIREDFPLDGIQPMTYEFLELLRRVKEYLPFNFRYEKENPKSPTSGHADYVGLELTVHLPHTPINTLLMEAVQLLPPGWQLTQFPHQMLLYKEHPRQRDYVSGFRLYPSS
jgi:hypothetical protein